MPRGRGPIPPASMGSPRGLHCRDPSVLAQVTGMVAVVEGLSHEVVKGRLADQLAVLLARAGGRALRRRYTLPSNHISFQYDAVATLYLDP